MQDIIKRSFIFFLPFNLHKSNDQKGTLVYYNKMLLFTQDNKKVDEDS